MQHPPLVLFIPLVLTVLSATIASGIAYVRESNRAHTSPQEQNA